MLLLLLQIKTKAFKCTAWKMRKEHIPERKASKSVS